MTHEPQDISGLAELRHRKPEEADKLADANYRAFIAKASPTDKRGLDIADKINAQEKEARHG